MWRCHIQIFFILCSFLPPTHAGTNEPGVSERTPFQIFSSCAATLFLSVFAALHLNVDPSRSPWKRAVKKLGWVLLAMTAPEYLVYMALIEWRVSRRVCREGQVINDLPEPATHRVNPGPAVNVIVFSC
jgi:hypothetical protein